MSRLSGCLETVERVLYNEILGKSNNRKRKSKAMKSDRIIEMMKNPQNHSKIFNIMSST